ncbi:MAG: hypothetical protein AABX83_03100 [Nanoarchaeota archaeon]
MENRDFKESLLKDKKKKFKMAVMEAADRLGVRQPVVKFWECPYQPYNPDEIAHCHHEMFMICISERRLDQRTDEDIIETATHEVTHLKHPDHSSSFHNTHQNLMASSWRPPSGVGITAFSEADLQRSISKSKPSKPDKRHCNYYQTKQHSKQKLEQCKYCQRWFCKEHIEARPAGLTNFEDYNKLSKDLQEEVNNKNTHPCLGYNDYFEKKAKEQSEKYGEALNRILGTKRKRESSYVSSSHSNKSYNYKEDEEGYDLNDDYEAGRVEMYNPHKRNKGSSSSSYNIRKLFRNIFSFHLSSEIKRVLTQFFIALLIGLVLDYIYYQNLSLHYLFIGGVRDWFNILISLLNYGMGGGYDIFYLIINGIFYFYLFSTTIRLVYATITNLNKKGTILFIIGVAILLFVIFKYFSNIVY